MDTLTETGRLENGNRKLESRERSAWCLLSGVKSGEWRRNPETGDWRTEIGEWVWEQMEGLDFWIVKGTFGV